MKPNFSVHTLYEENFDRNVLGRTCGYQAQADARCPIVAGIKAPSRFHGGQARRKRCTRPFCRPRLMIDDNRLLCAQYRLRPNSCRSELRSTPDRSCPGSRVGAARRSEHRSIRFRTAV